MQAKRQHFCFNKKDEKDKPKLKQKTSLTDFFRFFYLLFSAAFKSRTQSYLKVDFPEIEADFAVKFNASKRTKQANLCPRVRQHSSILLQLTGTQNAINIRNGANLSVDDMKKRVREL